MPNFDPEAVIDAPPAPAVQSFDPDAPVDAPAPKAVSFDPEDSVDHPPVKNTAIGDAFAHAARSAGSGTADMLSAAQRLGEKYLPSWIISDKEKAEVAAQRAAGQNPDQQLRAASEGIETDPKREGSTLNKVADFAGQAAPVIAAGAIDPALAVAAGGTQMGGGALQSARAQGMSQAEQDRRLLINTAGGIALNAAPVPGLNKVGELIDSGLTSAAARKIAKVSAGAIGGGTVNATGDAAIQLAEDGKIDPHRLLTAAAIGAGGGAIHGLAGHAEAPVSEGGPVAFDPGAEVGPSAPETPSAVPSTSPEEVRAQKLRDQGFNPDGTLMEVAKPDAVTVDGKPVAPAKFIGNTKDLDGNLQPQFEVTHEGPGLEDKIGSTVSKQTLESAGYHVPDTPLTEDGVAQNTQLSDYVGKGAEPEAHGFSDEPAEPANSKPAPKALEEPPAAAPVDIGPRDSTVSDGTGTATPHEQAMLSDWKNDPEWAKYIEASKEKEQPFHPESPVGEPERASLDDDDAIERAAEAQQQPEEAGPAPAKMFQGRGASPEDVYGPDAVKEGRAVPVLGKGDYFAFTKEDAANYGDVTAHDVALKKPFTIDSTQAWNDLLKQADAPHLNSRTKAFYEHPENVPGDAEKVRKFLTSKGYDGVVVKNVEGSKALRETFGHDQAVRYAEEKGNPLDSPNREIKPLGRSPRTEPEVTQELSRYTPRAKEVVDAFKRGDGAAILREVAENGGKAGHLQSAYLAMKQMGLINTGTDRAFLGSLADLNPDVFRVFEGADTFTKAGIVAFPPLPSAPELISKSKNIAYALKELGFNTTGGVDKFLFDQWHEMHGANSRMVEESKRIASDISEAYKGKMTDSQMEVAAAFLNRRRLNRLGDTQANFIKDGIANLTPDQRTALEAGRARIDKMTQDLIVAGVPKSEFAEIMATNVGNYISRSYQIFGLNGDKYISDLRTKGTDANNTAYQPAVRMFGKDFVDKLLDTVERKKELSRSQIDSLVKTQIDSISSTAALDRKVKEEAIRNLYGEIIDPVESIAHTLVKQQELLGTYNFRKKITDHLIDSGEGRRIDPDQIVQEYISNEQARIKETADQQVANVKANYEKRGEQMSPDIEKLVRDSVAEKNPSYSAQVDARAKALYTRALSSGDEADMAKATSAAEREVFREYEDSAFDAYGKSGAVKSGETLVRNDPGYARDWQMQGRVNDPYAAMIVSKSGLKMLGEYKKLEPPAMGLFRQLSTLANTGATTFSPMTTARNILSSWQTALTSGNIARMGGEAGRDALRAAAAITAHRIGGLELSPEHEGVYNKLLEAGVLNKGALSGDTMNAVEALRGLKSRASAVGRMVAARDRISTDAVFGKTQRIKPEEAIAKMAWGKEALDEKGLRKTQDLYQMGDDTPKIANFLLEKAKAKEAYGDTPEADAQALRKFKMTNFDYSRAIPLVRLVRQYPIVGGFTSFLSEAYRTGINSVQLALEDSYQGAKTGNGALLRQGLERAAGTAVALSLAAVAAQSSRDNLGISYEDERDLKKMLPAWDQNSHIYWYKSADGKISYANLGHLELYESLTRPVVSVLQRVLHGDVSNDPTATVMKEITDQAWKTASPFLNPTIFTNSVLEAYNGRTASGVPLYNADDSQGDKLMKGFAHVAKAVAVPGAVKQVMPVIQAAQGETDRRGDPIEATHALQGLFGMGQIDLNDGVKYVARDNALKMRGIEAEFKRAVDDKSNATTADSLYDTLGSVNERRKDFFSAISRSASVAQSLGLDQTQVTGQLKDLGLNKTEVQAILKGDYDPYSPTRETYKRAAAAGHPLDAKVVRSIVDQSR